MKNIINILALLFSLSNVYGQFYDEYMNLDENGKIPNSTQSIVAENEYLYSKSQGKYSVWYEVLELVFNKVIIKNEIKLLHLKTYGTSSTINKL